MLIGAPHDGVPAERHGARGRLYEGISDSFLKSDYPILNLI